jgi:energy-coupling factor transporter ATP-binding protein EcfA2
MNNENTNGMKVISLQAKNTMNLSAIEIIPEGNTVVLTGKNGAGKSNVLKAMEFALSGKALSSTPEPVKHGEKSGDILLDLGEIVVRRHFTNDTSTLKVENAEGMFFKSPQALLDKFRGNISFDPLEFAGLPEKQQKEILLSMIDLPIDLDELDSERKRIYEDRTLANRNVKRVESQVGAVPLKGVQIPNEEESTADVMAEMQAATEQIAANKITRDSLDVALSRKQYILDDIEELELKLKANKENLIELDVNLSKLAPIVGNLVDPGLEVFKTKLADVEKINQEVRAMQKYNELKAELNDYMLESQEYTDKINEIDALKTKTIGEAGMPVIGLGFNETGVTFEDIPLSQRSSAEQRKISMSIGMAMNPDLKVLWLKDASLLDSDSIEDVKAMADEKGYQVWLECVGDDKNVGIYIEDGVVVT